MYLVSTSKQLIHEIPGGKVFCISLKPRFRSLLKTELRIHHSDGGERYLLDCLYWSSNTTPTNTFSKPIKMDFWLDTQFIHTTVEK